MPGIWGGKDECYERNQFDNYGNETLLRQQDNSRGGYSPL